jgi:hypothetical protein
MTLHLVAVFINTPKKVSTAMHIEHDSLPLVSRLLTLIVISFHLNPFRP